jgi:hypothetical protein
VLAECIAGTEEAFANVMNENAQRLGLTTAISAIQRLAGRGQDLRHRPRPGRLARAEIENHPTSTRNITA